MKYIVKEIKTGNEIVKFSEQFAGWSHGQTFTFNKQEYQIEHCEYVATKETHPTYISIKSIIYVSKKQQRYTSN